jgi:TRAP-type mannitol/chloroaromatic compound transport system substrate-binding protein
MVVFPCGNGGQELGLFSNKRAVKMEDFQGMRIRTVGWYMDILTQMGASVTPLPGGEIFLALERGMIDACEFSAPAINLPMGFHEITKYCIQPGVHQPAVQCEAFINRNAWEELPEDLQALVEICARETQGWSTPWIENLNIGAIEEFGQSIEFVPMDDETLIEFRKVTKSYMDGLKEKHPDVRKILESQESFIKDFAPWRELRGRVAPWPYERYIEGQITQ